PELRLALGVTARDAHNVSCGLLDEIGILVDQRLAHPRGMLLIDTEDDGLLIPVAALLEEGGDLPSYEPGAVIDDERAIEILGIVDPVLDLLAMAVELPLLRPVP